MVGICIDMRITHQELIEHIGVLLLTTSLSKEAHTALSRMISAADRVLPQGPLEVPMGDDMVDLIVRDIQGIHLKHLYEGARKSLEGYLREVVKAWLQDDMTELLNKVSCPGLLGLVATWVLGEYTVVR
jgi:hypothetical protein